MKINPNLLKRLAHRFGVVPLSIAPPVQSILAHPHVFIKAPAGFEPLITGGGYQWDDELNGYRLGSNQKIFLLPDGRIIWVFKDAVFRLVTPNSIQKWVSADDEYSMGKANAFFIVYGKLTNQDLGQNETAGDEVPDGEESDDDGGGVATADSEGTPFSKSDVQKMLAGGWPDDMEGGTPSMDSAIPSEDPTGLDKEPSAPAKKNPMPDRTKVGQPLSHGDKADSIIRAIKHRGQVKKEHPVKLTTDEIIDYYNAAKSLPPEQMEKVIAFLKSGAVKQVTSLKEGIIYKSQLQALLEHIIQGIVREVDNAQAKVKKRWTVKLEKEQTGASAAGPVTGPNAFKKKSVPMENRVKSSSTNSVSYQEIYNQQIKDGKSPQDAAKAVLDIVTHGTWVAWDTAQVNKAIEVIQNKCGSALQEMTTTSGGGGSSAGTPGYNIPGAWAGGSLEKNKKNIEVLGYTLTPAGKKEMKRAGDNLFEGKEFNTEKLCQKCGAPMAADSTKCPVCQFLNDDTPEDKKIKHGALEEASGLGADFDRAQHQYDNQSAPEGDGLECPECGQCNGFYTQKEKRGRFFMWNAECPDCKAQWGDDNLDSD